ncbi:uncharacterized protein H6S33_003257 [Morchella sextelata]|jgi:ankyrin repeat protein|uniref:uncharacterized protein n=1 Tax=Morchella sextelata TaxID=1174677 RepID=UPI001D058C4A|nr:uncharacterized protein H6S33_003257 [Morchella sextelata]KAH0607269.1 hypothetical protein H6S33_003257 [Morchella sextelata]
MSLLALANEILLIIASNLSTRDLINFQVNHRLHSLLTPALTRLMLARKDPLLLWAAHKGRAPLLRRLLANGASLAYVGNRHDWPRKELYQQRTVLHLASECGHVELVKLLITEGADVNNAQHKPQQYASTALHLAAKRGDVAVAEALVDGGAELELKDRSGATALFFSVKGGHEEVVKFLVDRGADVNTTDCAMTTLYQMASTRGFLEIERILLDAGAVPEATDEDQCMLSPCINGV